MVIRRILQNREYIYPSEYIDSMDYKSSEEMNEERITNLSLIRRYLGLPLYRKKRVKTFAGNMIIDENNDNDWYWETTNIQVHNNNNFRLVKMILFTSLMILYIIWY